MAVRSAAAVAFFPHRDGAAGVPPGQLAGGAANRRVRRRAWLRLVGGGAVGRPFEGIDVGDQVVDLRLGEDPSPVRHADERVLSNDAAGFDHGGDLLRCVELLEEVGRAQWRDGGVRRLRVGHAAEAVWAVAVDAAEVDVVDRPGDGRSLPLGDGQRERRRATGGRPACR